MEEGRDPKGVFRKLRSPLTTHAHSTVEQLEHGANAAEDRERCAAFMAELTNRELGGAR